MDLGGLSWSLITIVGPVVLLAVAAWAIWRNKKSRVPDEVTEEGTRRVYREEEQARRSGTDGES